MLFAQSAPTWYDFNMRKMMYADTEYFTGFAEGSLMENERPEVATQRLKDAARVEAVSTIQVHVKDQTTNNIVSKQLSTMDGDFWNVMNTFTSSTTTSVDMNIPGLQIESWRDPQTGTISA